MDATLGCNMKKLSIEFVRNQNWRWIWAFVGVCSIALILVSTRDWRINSADTTLIENQLELLRKPVLNVGKPSETKLDDRYSSTSKALTLIQQDLNAVFATIENINDPAIRLSSMALDVPAGVLRLEYELDSIEVAVILTEKLNGGYEMRPWKLESLNATKVVTSLNQQAVSPKIVGIWTMQLKNI
jgi:hypothetical protein